MPPISKLQIPTAAVFQPLLSPSRYKGAHGGRGCLHPDALIDTPSGQVKVSEFKGGEVYSWFNGDVVVADATPAQKYTVEDLFEVMLDSGESIIATDQHKFLTRRGWVELSDLSKSDAVVVLRGQVASFRQQTSLGSGPSVSQTSVLHWTQKREDYLGDCSEYLRQYGQRLQSVKGSGPTSPPSPADVLRRNIRALSRLGGRVSCGIHSLSSTLCRLSSRAVLLLTARQCYAASETHTFERISGQPSAFSRSFPQSLLKNTRTLPFLGSSQPQSCRGTLRSQGKNSGTLGGKHLRISLDSSCESPCGSGDFTISGVRLIRKHSRQAYWDLHVYGTNNYLSNGIVNHNSGKSHFFAGLGVEDALRWPGEAGEGLRMVCIREVQKSLKESAKRLIEDKLIAYGLGEAQGFKVFREVIETPGDGLITFTGMQDHTADSVKSLEGFHRAWVEEAQSLSSRSMELLRPTIRWENEGLGLASELWFSWNPDRPTAPVDMMLRGERIPTGASVVRANWSDNPWFTKVLEQERRDCLEQTPEKYPHIWEGEYATVLEGAYYAKSLTQAQLEGRICFVPREQLNKIYAIWDIGSTSRKADATSIWVVQFIGDEVRLLNYYEAVGQSFDEHVHWLRNEGYEDAVCVLPHDGVKHDTVYKVTPKAYLMQAGFTVDVIENQGAGAAMKRIEAARQMFPYCRFNDETTQGGREALGWYHEKRDEVRGIGLGPDHDWSSHAADSFGAVAVYRSKIYAQLTRRKGPLRRNLAGIA